MLATYSNAFRQQSLKYPELQHCLDQHQTSIDLDFIKGRQSSWQVQLNRISHFLVYGKGVWWERKREGYHFFDGDTDLNMRPEGPILYHFNNTIEDVEECRML